MHERDWRPLDKYRRCIWQICSNEASDRYHIPLCQEHILYVWSLVDEDMRSADTQPDGIDPNEHVIDQAEADRKGPPPAGWIYYLQVGDYLKIGYTKNIYRRLTQYPPNALLLAQHPGTRDDEQELHRRFSAYRDAGREWYIDATEIRDHIAGIRPEGTPKARRVGRSRADTGLRLRNSTRRAATSVIL